MSDQQEKRQIAEIIEKRVNTNLKQIQGTRTDSGRSSCTTTVSTLSVAETIIDAGYGNLKKAVRKFAEKLIDKIKTLEVAEDENFIFKAGFETLQENLPDIILKLVKEEYGADKKEQERRQLAQLLCTKDSGSPCGGKCEQHEQCAFLSMADNLLACGFGNVKKAQSEILEQVKAQGSFDGHRYAVDMNVIDKLINKQNKEK